MKSKYPYNCLVKWHFVREKKKTETKNINFGVVICFSISSTMFIRHARMPTDYGYRVFISYSNYFCQMAANQIQ